MMVDGVWQQRVQQYQDVLMVQNPQSIDGLTYSGTYSDM